LCRSIVLSPRLSDVGMNNPPVEPYPGYLRQGPPPQLRMEAVTEALEYLRRDLWTWVGAAGVMLIAIGAFYGVAMAGMFAAMAGHTAIGFTIYILGYLVSFVATYVIGGGMFLMALRQIRGEPIEISMVFAGLSRAGSLVGFGLLQMVLYMAGAIFCLVPGLIVLGVTMFGPLFIMDRRMGAIEAMRSSYEALKPHLWMSVLFVMVAYILASIGIAACFVGIVASLPFMYLMIALGYRDVVLAPQAAAAPLDFREGPTGPHPV
jgi:hypothetical protein